MYKIKTMNHISPYGLQKLEERGIFNRTEEMNKALALLSKQAADGKAWVAGDIAPRSPVEVLGIDQDIGVQRDLQS